MHENDNLVKNNQTNDFNDNKIVKRSDLVEMVPMNLVAITNAVR